MLSVIIPVFNGEAGLAALYQRLEPVLDSLDDGCEIIFIDDGSSDGSLALIKEICCGSKIAGWASLADNCGQQTAVLCGLRLCRGDRVVTLDDDLQHPPEFIPELLSKAAGGGFDAVYAVPGGSANAGGRMRDAFFSVLLGKPEGMKIGSFRIFSRAAVDYICRADSRFVYISAELFSRDFKVTSVNYNPESRPIAGPSRYGTLRRLGLYLRLVIWYTPVFRGPVKILTGCGKPQYVIAETGGII